jgi:hypothetical protein
MSNRTKTTLTEYIVAFIIALPFIVGFSALGAYVFMLLWNWALVGLFPSLPLLDFYRAWGLTILLSFVGSFFKGGK